jgi:hypothetical protein
MQTRPLVLTGLLVVAGSLIAVQAQRGGPGGPDPATDPFVGVTTDGTVRAGFFEISASS